MSHYPLTEYRPTDLLATGEDVSFEEHTHTYQVLSNKSGVVAPPSVSLVLRTVFGNPYYKVDYDKLLKAQNKGKVVHDEIKHYLIHDVRGFSSEFFAFLNNLNHGDYYQDRCYCEQYVFADTPSGMYAGTLDTLWLNHESIVDYKTSAKLDRANTKRQLNMYCYAVRRRCPNFRIKKLEAWHLSGTDCKVVSFPIEPDIYVETIMRAYYEGRTFKNDKEMMDFYYPKDEESPNYKKEKEYDDSFKKDCSKIAQVDELLAQLKNTREKLVERIKEHLERRNIDNIQLEGISISYIPESEKTMFDSATFKEKEPETYKQFLKKSVVKSHIRISYPKEK